MHAYFGEINEFHTLGYSVALYALGEHAAVEEGHNIFESRDLTCGELFPECIPFAGYEAVKIPCRKNYLSTGQNLVCQLYELRQYAKVPVCSPRSAGTAALIVGPVAEVIRLYIGKRLEYFSSLAEDLLHSAGF